MTTSHDHRRTGPVAIAYGMYAWIAFVACVLFAILVALLLPGLERRRRWVSAAARFSFTLSGIAATVEGLETLPAGHCIVVANHASYLDGVILQAFLPPRFSYVIKGEMQNVPGVHFLLRRIGAKFVERFVTSGSARDARALLKAASAGESLAFFPEGTFVREPGLGRFRPGAFAAAIKGELPIVPLAILGSREVLPGGTMLPRRARLRVAILPAIPPQHDAFGSSAMLAEAARQRILGILDEPDLLA
ncbi:MAG: 1-acyl-sn-glycerol-3-phosphate acyltransferase [Gammaproteobacteria bacterium]|nr:1-acyl-sn-glycerol-3-phosphate acyltransferase [Gammaproteobacteria bacterium]MDH4313823.1 1-acyl-sn-glycerol-3-phosphate acyltransferase [Gammaproteobacteria bacterium]MDH5213699.1 1-acyl-sn-glycerol-3-phosphate acyltransferase [Gammaproteobacteria bacterium]